MTEQLFLDTIADALELNREQINMDDEFRTYQEWDSLTFLSLLTLLNEDFSLNLSISSFNNIQTWRDLYGIMPK